MLFKAVYNSLLVREKKSEENSEPDETVRGSFTVLKFIIIFFLSQWKILFKGKYFAKENAMTTATRYTESRNESFSRPITMCTEKQKDSLIHCCLNRNIDFLISARRFVFSFFSLFFRNNDHSTVICIQVRIVIPNC